MSGIVGMVVAGVVAGFILAFGACAVLVRQLPRWQFKQIAYEDAPQTHQRKTGTPTMGGICFAVSILPLVAVAWARNWDVFGFGALALVVWGCGIIGFVDDYLAIRQGKNGGLRARTKYLATALVAVVFLRLIAIAPVTQMHSFVLFHAGSYALVAPYWLWLLLGILAITGTVHAVNLTDGLDGLASGTMIAPLCALAVIGLQWFAPAPAITALLLIGGCIGFLLYNHHPARMFMGDTGSLALGAGLSGIAIASGEMLLLLLVGGVYVAETLSVIVQVTYFKVTKGKRVFKMSPLHHHFELSGWPETEVTRVFIAASVVLSAAGLAIVR